MFKKFIVTSLFVVLLCFRSFAGSGNLVDYTIRNKGTLSSKFVITSVSDSIDCEIGDTYTLRFSLKPEGNQYTHLYLTEGGGKVISCFDINTAPKNRNGTVLWKVDVIYDTYPDTFGVFQGFSSVNVGDIVPNDAVSAITAHAKPQCLIVRQNPTAYVEPYSAPIVDEAISVGGVNYEARSAGVPAGAWYMDRQRLIHGGRVTEFIAGTQYYDMYIPCGVYVYKTAPMFHSTTNHRCHMSLNIPTIGHQGCGERDDSYVYAKQIDASWEGQWLGSEWLERSEGGQTHITNVYNVKLYHWDLDVDGRCDGCGKPIGHEHHYEQKWYSENGVGNEKIYYFHSPVQLVVSSN